MQDHQNYITRDTKKGPIILSLKQEEDYQGNLARVLIRTQKETVYKLIPSSQLPAGTTKVEPEDYIKVGRLVLCRASKQFTNTNFITRSLLLFPLFCL